jgi:hypothetical protein
MRPRKNGVVLLKPSLAHVSLSLFFQPCEEVSTRSFYSSRSGSYNETRGPTGGTEVVEIIYNIYGPNG